MREPNILIGPPKNRVLTVTYFENLIIEFHVLFVLKTHVKFHVNRILFTI